MDSGNAAVSSLLKDVYSPAFYDQLCDSLEKTLGDFDRNRFLREIFDDRFESLELKQRMTHTIDAIAGFLPQDFARAAAKICELIDNLKQAGVSEQGFEYMFLPEFIETRGLDDYPVSIRAFEHITQFTSCEFAVRPFIHKYGQKMLDQMFRWTRHEHAMVRRLASEGARPRLPWAMALPALKQDPAPLLPILDNLKQDESVSVRRSVANNLNDVSKDNPDIVIALVKKWRGTRETDALVKHACRTLLKQGNSEALRIFGYETTGIETSVLTLNTTRVQFGNALTISFSVSNKTESARKVRIEYAIHHLKKNGELTRKVFFISERELPAGSQLEIERKHAFKPITTRKYYAGLHRVSFIVNGVESTPSDFELII